MPSVTWPDAFQCPPCQHTSVFLFLKYLDLKLYDLTHVAKHIYIYIILLLFSKPHRYKDIFLENLKIIFFSKDPSLEKRTEMIRLVG